MKCMNEVGPAQMIERRGGHRLQVDWPVVVFRSTGDVLVGRVLDVSEEGLRLRSAYAFASGSLLRLRLRLPGSGEHVLRSRVCYQVLEMDFILTGVRFENSSRDSIEALRVLCCEA